MARTRSTAARAGARGKAAAARPELEVIDRRAGGDRRRKARRESDRLELIESSFQVLAPQGEAIVARFYERLFERHPEVRPLFEGADMGAQQRKLLAALRLVVENLRRPEELTRVLRELGRRHQGYGARPEHYPLVAETLLEVLAEFAGPAWTEPVADAWRSALGQIAETMIEAYEQEEDGKMAASPEAALAGGAGTGVVDSLDVLKDILEHAPINIMIADADERIVFVNRRAREVLESLEDELAKYLPGFRADEVVGGSIHRYHRDPDAVRRILQGLRPGEPRRGEITPGPFVFEHETRVLVDRAGNRIGYVVQWHDVTEKRLKEEQAQRLQRAVDGAQTAMMTIDRDLVITYVNEETKRLMRRHAEVLRRLYPGFDPENLVGQCIDQFHKNPAHQRRLLADPSNLPYETDIEVGPLTFHIRVSAIHDLKGNYVGNTLEWADVTELRRREIEVARLQSAVDGAETALMLCDEEGVITYTNPAVVELLERRREQLQRVWPGFDPRKLVGRNIDEFHKNPAHQRSILRDPSRLPYRGHIKLLDLEFEVNATAVLDKEGRYMGNMVEWKDVTEQKDAERQIEGLIAAAARGELDRRLEAERYEGFMGTLAEGVNGLLDAVVEPLKAAIAAAKALADGDLTAEMKGEYEGAYGELAEAINGSLANMLRMVGRIREAAANIAAAAAEIAQGNADLSQRTEEQASSLEETASSMEQMTSTVKQNADNARQANQLAAGAREQAEKGGEVVGAAVAAMGEINQASKKIADIIGVIDEIAFQTNLLALNAAVEAARAGEQGRGFAVVAAEVRNLAQRSAAAAKEIKGLIKDSVEKVEEGTRLVDASGKTLEEIVAAVKKVSDIVAEIAAASQEQSVGIEQVNKAIMQLDEATQQNAALVEETAAASQSMDEQARQLGELMAFFRTGEEDERREAAAPPRAARPARPARAGEGGRRRPAASAARPRPAADEGEDWEEF